MKSALKKEHFLSRIPEELFLLALVEQHEIKFHLFVGFQISATTHDYCYHYFIVIIVENIRPKQIGDCWGK
jgi:hypothetical protein